jgi:hypothetical protein
MAEYPALIPCSSPNNRNATTAESKVSAERTGLRMSPDQMSGRYFIPRFLLVPAPPPNLIHGTQKRPQGMPVALAAVHQLIA